MKKVEINISGMSCGGCTKKVENALKNLKDVKHVSVSLKENKAFAEVSDNLTQAILKSSIDGTGYIATKIEFK